jgi:hypothetical protein
MALVAAWKQGRGRPPALHRTRLRIHLQDGFHADRLTAGRRELGGCASAEGSQIRLVPRGSGILFCDIGILQLNHELTH